jgi:hypothetical protein
MVMWPVGRLRARLGMEARRDDDQVQPSPVLPLERVDALLTRAGGFCVTTEAANRRRLLARTTT